MSNEIFNSAKDAFAKTFNDRNNRGENNSESTSLNDSLISSSEENKIKTVSRILGESSHKQVDQKIYQQVDVVVIVALKDEREQFEKCFETEWKTVPKGDIQYKVGTISFGNRTISIAVGTQNQMGMVDAGILTTYAIRDWKPKLVAMCGICAGIQDETRLGDIVVADQLYDYGSGKIKKGEFHPSFKPVPLSSKIHGMITTYTDDDLVTIQKSWPNKTGKPETQLKLRVGVIGSGASVVADNSYIDKLFGNERKLTGIEMEAYGVARASHIANVPFIIVKGVQDYADEEKDNRYREYSAFVSAKFFENFIISFGEQILGEA